MTAEAERELMQKHRRGEPITPEDHITTIDDLDELEGFRMGLRDYGTLTVELTQAIARRKAQILRKR